MAAGYGGAGIGGYNIGGGTQSGGGANYGGKGDDEQPGDGWSLTRLKRLYTDYL